MIKYLLAFIPVLAWAAPKPPLAVELAEPVTQVVPTMKFYVVPAKGPAPLTSKFTWSSVGATGCVASGTAPWTGTKATNGTETLVFDVKGKVVLTCYSDTPAATVNWTIPTVNTDGSPLTNLAGFKLYVSATSGGAASATPIDINNPTTTTYTVSSLPAGLNYFAMKSYNTLGAESTLTGEVGSDIPSMAAAIQRWITITAPPPPPPTDITVTHP